MKQLRPEEGLVVAGGGAARVWVALAEGPVVGAPEVRLAGAVDQVVEAVASEEVAGDLVAEGLAGVGAEPVAGPGMARR